MPALLSALLLVALSAPSTVVRTFPQTADAAPSRSWALAHVPGPRSRPVTTARSAGQLVALAVPASATHYGWPLPGAPRPVRRFDPPPQPWASGHRGVDLAAVPGTLVRAAGDGTVRYAGQLVDRPLLSIAHPDGLRTTYEPVRPLVAVGDRVVRGQPIGVLLPGHRGCPAEGCLHWGLRDGERYLDPLTLLGLGRVRLLPPS